MVKLDDSEVVKEIQSKSDLFFKKIKSEMQFRSKCTGDMLAFDWVDEIESACPFIDNVVRKPKLILVQEELIVKAEKSKRVNVQSVKDLARHTNYIDKVNKKTQDVTPSKILDIRNEETYNIYENRFLYTLIADLDRFIRIKEELLNEFKLVDNKLLEYAASSETQTDKIDIEVSVNSQSLPAGKKNKKLEKDIRDVKKRIKRIREYISSWQKSDMVKALDKAHISYIKPPVKPTNIILKNPNFKVAVKLWDFIRGYDYREKNSSKEGNDNPSMDNLKGFLDHSFLIDYYVLDSISKSRKEEKDKMSKYAIELLTQEIYRTISLLLDNGVKITDEELLKLIAQEIKTEKEERLVGVDDVKKKFKNAMDEYLERTQDYL